MYLNKKTSKFDLRKVELIMFPSPPSEVNESVVLYPCLYGFNIFETQFLWMRFKNLSMYEYHIIIGSKLSTSIIFPKRYFANFRGFAK